jgi:hypothetical protein
MSRAPKEKFGFALKKKKISLDESDRQMLLHGNVPKM